MTTTVERLIEQLAGEPRCHVAATTGLPVAAAPLELPADLRRFYELCGGADLFLGADFECRIVPPSEFLPANRVIVGQEFPHDRSDSWFVVARTQEEPLAVIDLDESRRGRCYDAFHEIYGVAGSMSVIANSFSELLASLVRNAGRHWYWLRPEWISLGDAYD